MAFKPQTNVKYQVRFPWGDYKEGESQYGPYYQYGVEVDGQADTWFADRKAHDAVQPWMKAGAVLEITKKQEQFQTEQGQHRTRNIWLIGDTGQVDPSPSHNQPNGQSGQSEEALATVGPPPKVSTKARKKAYELIYFEAAECALSTLTSLLGIGPDQVDQQALQAATATLVIQQAKDRELVNGYLRAAAKQVEEEAKGEQLAGVPEYEGPPEAPDDDALPF